MGRKRKDQEFIIEEIPGDGDLGELLAMSIVEYINEFQFLIGNLQTLYARSYHVPNLAGFNSS